MLKRIKLLFVCLFLILISTLSACSLTTPPNTPVLENTVRSYLANLNNNNFEQAYNLNILSHQYPHLTEIKAQYNDKIIKKKSDFPIDNYTINIISFYENMAIASLCVTSEKKEYNGFLTLINTGEENKKKWLVYSIYPILQSSIPNSLVASSKSEHWTAEVYLILSNQLNQTGRGQLTAIRVQYTGNNPVTKYELKKEIPEFTEGLIIGQRPITEAILNPRFSATDYSSGTTKKYSLKQAKKLLREGKITVTWQEDNNITKSEEIKFNSYQTVLWQTSTPSNL